MNALDKWLLEPYEKAAARAEKRESDINAEADALMAEWVSLASASAYVDNYELLLEERHLIVNDVATCMAMMSRGDLTKDSAAAYLGNQIINRVKAGAMKIATHHVEGTE